MNRPGLLWPPVLTEMAPAVALELEGGRRVLLYATRLHEEDCDLGCDCTCGAMEEGLRDLEDALEALGYELPAV